MGRRRDAIPPAARHPVGDADRRVGADPRERFASRCPACIATPPPDRPRAACVPRRSVAPSNPEPGQEPLPLPRPVDGALLTEEAIESG